MHESPSGIRVEIPQPKLLRSSFLGVACIAYFMGRFGGTVGPTENRILWWIVAAWWFLLYFWALLVPYLRLTPDRVLIAENPFSLRLKACLHAPFDVVVTEDAIELHHGPDEVDSIPFDKVPEEDRSRLIEGLQDLSARATVAEQEEHGDFVATWGVDPLEVDPAAWADGTHSTE